MATAILRLWPDANSLPARPSRTGFTTMWTSSTASRPRISPPSSEMKKEIKANHTFEKVVVTRDQAIKDSESGRLGGLAERPGNPSKFKLGNLADIPDGEPSPTTRTATSLTSAPAARDAHRQHRRLQAHQRRQRLLQGRREQPQLQRIYGTAFKNKTELEAYFKMLEEAKRRDHRKIGQEMGLYVIDADFTAPACRSGCPKRCHRRGAGEAGQGNRVPAGYVRVKTPHIAREKMYKTSGHLPYYAESMFPDGAGRRGRPAGQAFPGGRIQLASSRSKSWREAATPRRSLIGTSNRPRPRRRLISSPRATTSRR